jgi:hypothetical protein
MIFSYYKLDVFIQLKLKYKKRASPIYSNMAQHKAAPYVSKDGLFIF